MMEIFSSIASDDLVKMATITGGFATAIAAAFAIVGIPLALFQVRASRAIQREATAKMLYRQYLEDAVRHADFTAPDLAKLQSSGRFAMYELYVAHMMFALEEVLAGMRDKEWRNVVSAQLKRHQEYLKGDLFQHHKRGLYGSDILGLIDKL